MRIAVSRQRGEAYAHLRHLAEALLRCPDAEVFLDTDPSEPRDWTFHGRGRTGRSLWRCCADPHGFVHELDLRVLVDDEVLGFAPPPLCDELREYLGCIYAEWLADRKPLLGLYDSWDAVAFHFYDPMVTRFSPLLKHAVPLWLPHCVPEWIFDGDPRGTRPVDVTWAGAVAYWYPFRVAFTQALQDPARRGSIRYVEHEPRQYDCNCDVTAEVFDDSQRRFCGWLREAKIGLTDGTVFGYQLGRHFEIPASGALLMCPRFRDAERLGFVDGEHYVQVHPSDWLDKLRYYLEHDEERVRIAEAGHRLVHERYSATAQAREVVRLLGAL